MGFDCQLVVALSRGDKDLLARLSLLLPKVPLSVWQSIVSMGQKDAATDSVDVRCILL